MIVNISVSLIPLLIVKLLIVMVSRMDCEVLCHPSRQLQLLVSLVQKQVILLTHHTVTVCTVLGKHLKTSSDAA